MEQGAVIIRVRIFKAVAFSDHLKQDSKRGYLCNGNNKVCSSIAEIQGFGTGLAIEVVFMVGDTGFEPVTSTV